jgi:hypothetical protein
MKKLFFIFIPVIFIDLCFDGEQFIKLPSLIEHYNEHQSSDKISILKFLLMHYVEHHSQNNEHQNLPFKNHQDCSHIHFYTYHSDSEINISNYLSSEKKSYVLFDENFSLEKFVSIWHPPKISV